MQMAHWHPAISPVLTLFQISDVTINRISPWQEDWRRCHKYSFDAAKANDADVLDAAEFTRYLQRRMASAMSLLPSPSRITKPFEREWRMMYRRYLGHKSDNVTCSDIDIGNSQIVHVYFCFFGSPEVYFKLRTRSQIYANAHNSTLRIPI